VKYLHPAVLILAFVCATPAKAESAGAVFESYQGIVGKKAKFTLLLRRETETVSGFYFYDAIKADIPLVGALTAEGGFLLTERNAKGKPVATFRGKVTGTHVSGRWIESAGAKGKPARDLPFLADRSMSFPGIDKFEEQSFDGLLGGKHPIRMALAGQGGKISGYYRYRRSKDDLKLEGQVSAQGEFQLTERDGQGKTTGVFTGLFVPGLRVFGEWSNPARTRILPVRLKLSRTAMTQVVELKPGVRLVPREITFKDKACDAAGSYYELTGLANPATAKKITTTLQALADKNSGCEPVESPDESRSSSSYSVSKPLLLGKFLVFTQDFYGEGGAHPNWSSESLVFDTETGATVDLMTYMKPGRAAAFSQFINRQIKAEATDAEDIFGEGNLDSGHLYPAGNGLTIVFSPDEITPYVMGALETSLSAHDATKFFQSTPDTRVLFGW
jgi:hypothetical protein